jgi:hypothetical protein
MILDTLAQEISSELNKTVTIGVSEHITPPELIVDGAVDYEASIEGSNSVVGVRFSLTESNLSEIESNPENYLELKSIIKNYLDQF